MEDYKILENHEIHGTPVKVKVVKRLVNDPNGDWECYDNVVDYQGREYDVICNGEGDCYILVEGKKRWLEEPDPDKSKFPYPKQVMDFADRYNELYNSHGQYKTAYGYLQEEIQKLKTDINFKVLEEAHGMVHDISFNIGNSNTEEARKLLKTLDILLHEAIHQESLIKGGVPPNE